MTFRFVDLVGRYRLVVTDALVEFIERALVEPSPASDRLVAHQPNKPPADRPSLRRLQ